MPFAISPLFAFLFDPFLAAAAVGGAVSIPIVIHLLNRKRYRIVPWAAMRFLLAAQAQDLAQGAIEQILLLVVRCLLILLLLLAMCSVTGWAEDWFWHPLAGKGLAGIGGAAHPTRSSSWTDRSAWGSRRATRIALKRRGRRPSRSSRKATAATVSASSSWPTRRA